MPADNQDLNVIQPACLHLRSKGMYVSGTMNPELDDFEMGDGNCWCNQTQHVVGPDEEMVERGQCKPGRNCYEPLV